MRRRTWRAPDDAQARSRVEAHVAAYAEFYGAHGARFPSAEESEALAADRAAYTGPLKARQAVAMVRQRVRFGSLWSREIERREFGE
jgi:hypothetical protein